MAGAASNPAIHFFPVSGADHFNLLSPATRLIAAKLRRDEGSVSNVAFTAGEVAALGRRGE
jgi:hypothetical protein